MPDTDSYVPSSDAGERDCDAASENLKLYWTSRSHHEKIPPKKERKIASPDPLASSALVPQAQEDVPQQESSAVVPTYTRSLRKRNARSTNPYSFERAMYVRSLNKTGWEDAVVTADREKSMRREEHDARLERDMDVSPGRVASNSLDSSSSGYDSQASIFSDKLSKERKSSASKKRHRKQYSSDPGSQPLSPSALQSSRITYDVINYGNKGGGKKKTKYNAKTRASSTPPSRSNIPKKRSTKPTSPLSFSDVKNLSPLSIRSISPTQPAKQRSNRQYRNRKIASDSAQRRSLKIKKSAQKSTRTSKDFAMNPPLSSTDSSDESVSLPWTRKNYNSKTSVKTSHGYPDLTHEDTISSEPENSQSLAVAASTHVSDSTDKEETAGPNTRKKKKKNSSKIRGVYVIEGPLKENVTRGIMAEEDTRSRRLSSNSLGSEDTVVMDDSIGSSLAPQSQEWLVEDLDQLPAMKRNRLDLTKGRKSALRGMMPANFVKRAEADLKLMKKEIRHGKKVTDRGSGDEEGDSDEENYWQRRRALPSSSLTQSSIDDDVSSRETSPIPRNERQSRISDIFPASENETANDASRIRRERMSRADSELRIPWPNTTAVPEDFKYNLIPINVDFSKNGQYISKGYLRDFLNLITSKVPTEVHPRTFVTFGYHLDSTISPDTVLGMLSGLCDSIYDSVGEDNVKVDCDISTAPLRFLAHYVEYRNDIFTGRLFLSFQSQFMHLCRRLSAINLAVSSPLSGRMLGILWIQWWMLEILVRMHSRMNLIRESMDGTIVSFSNEIDEISGFLIGPLTAQDPLVTLHTLFNYVESSERISLDPVVEIWICVINLAIESTKVPYLPDVILPRLNHFSIPQNSPRKEIVAVCERAANQALLLSAISQIQQRGQVGVPRFPTNWSILVPFQKLMASTYSDDPSAVSNTERTGRDNYIRIWLSRTLNLSQKWNWDVEFETVYVFYDIMKGNNLSGLVIDPVPEVPNFVSIFGENNTVMDNSDSFIQSFMKLVRVATRKLECFTDIERRRLLGRFLIRIVPTRSMLIGYIKKLGLGSGSVSQIINAYSFHVVGIILMQESVKQRMEQIRGLVIFKDAAVDTQKTIFRVVGELGKVCKHLITGPSFQYVYEWILEMMWGLSDEWKERSKDQDPSATRVSRAEWWSKGSNRLHEIASVFSFGIKTLRQILQTLSEAISSQYFLHNLWTLETLNSPISHYPFVGDEVLRLLNTSLDIFEKFREDEDQSDEEESYPFDEEFFQDPALDSLLGSSGSQVVTTAPEISTTATFDRTVYVSSIQSIIPALHTLANGLFSKKDGPRWGSNMCTRLSYLARIYSSVIRCTEATFDKKTMTWTQVTERIKPIWLEIPLLGRCEARLQWYIGASSYDPNLLKSGFCFKVLIEALVQPYWTEQNILLDKMVHVDELDVPIFRSLHMDPREISSDDRLDVISILVKDARWILREGLAAGEIGRYIAGTLEKLPELMRDFERDITYEREDPTEYRALCNQIRTLLS